MTNRSRDVRPRARGFGLGGWIALLLATGCSRAVDVAGLTADRPEAREFLLAHNRARAGIETSPHAPLPPLVWSTALARDAARAAARCALEHSRTDHGENLAAAAPALSPSEAVSIWLEERQDWDAATKRCRADRTCAHYTQLVWRETREVGCASRPCEGGGLGIPGPWMVTVCQYAPSGNRQGASPY
jgi:hypothetical protein